VEFDLTQEFPVGIGRLWDALGRADYIEQKYRSQGTTSLRISKLSNDGDTIEVVTDVQSPLQVIGHERLLRQAALNLMLNAVHAVRAQNLRQPRVGLSAYADHGSAALSVRDNGPGVPPELRGRLFEPSFTTKSEGGGSGLGLALTRLVVTRHGGTIEVESDTDGTAVTMRLPLAPRAVS